MCVCVCGGGGGGGGGGDVGSIAYPEEQWVLADSLYWLKEVGTNVVISFSSQQHTCLQEREAGRVTGGNIGGHGT